MTASKRLPDGTTIYRNQRIKMNLAIPANRRGRYTWNGQEFTLLAHAKAAVDYHFRDHDRAGRYGGQA